MPYVSKCVKSLDVFDPEVRRSAYLDLLLLWEQGQDSMRAIHEYLSKMHGETLSASQLLTAGTLMYPWGWPQTLAARLHRERPRPMPKWYLIFGLPWQMYKFDSFCQLMLGDVLLVCLRHLTPMTHLCFSCHLMPTVHTWACHVHCFHPQVLQTTSN